MGWRDTFGFVDQALRSAPRGVTGYSTFQSRFQPFSGASRGTSPSRRQKAVSWGDLATGRLAQSKPQVAQQAAPTRAQPPERFDIRYPYSSTQPRSPYAPPPTTAPVSTEGDLIGSVGGAVGGVLANLNLANAMPWFMERVNVLAGDVADLGVPGVSDTAGLLESGTDVFIDGIDQASQIVGPVLDAFPSWVRDQQLNDRAKLYRAIANGETPDFGPLGPVSNPLATVGQIANMPFHTAGTALERIAPEGPLGDIGRFVKSGGPTGWLFGETQSAMADDASYWQNELLSAVDPARRLQAEQRMAILRDSIDLPESVKLAIERDPRMSDDALAALFDEAPEGRAWSYTAGPQGVAHNLGNPLLIYGAEAVALSRGGSALGAYGRSVGGTTGRVIGLGGQGAAVTQRVLTASMAAGLGATAITTTMDAIARYAGADEAIAWFDNANRSTEFSDDPMVQLVTGFAVNPIRAAAALKAGTLTTKHGLVDIPVSKVLRGRLLRHYDSTTVVEDMTRRMFKLGSREEAAAFLDEQDLRSSAPDMIVANALDVILDRLPKEEKLAWVALHPDPAERAAATLQRYGRQALDLIEKQPDLVAARFHTYDWQYRMSTLPFNAEVAARIARDFRRATERTYDLRAEQRAVVGYREALPPRAQSLAKAALDETTIDGRVPIRTVTEVVGSFPVLRRYLGGRVASGDEQVSRAVVDEIIAEASADWARMARINPVKAATGHDPIIRPGSPTVLRDTAESLGISIDTARVFLEKFDEKSAAHAELLKAYLRAKVGLDEAAIATLTPEEAYVRAFAHFDETTDPWFAMGARLEAADQQIARAREELATIRREFRGDRTLHDRVQRKEREIRELEDLIRVAGDPVRTYAETAADVRAALPDAHLAEMAARKVDAMERLRVIQTVGEELRAVGIDESSLLAVTRGPDGEIAWAFDMAGQVPKQVADAFLAFKTANMYVVRSLSQKEHGQLTSRRVTRRELSNKGQQYVRDFEESPASYQWAEIVKSPGFLKRMRERGDEVVFQEAEEFLETGPTTFEAMTGSQVADIVDAIGLTKGTSGTPLDDIAEAMGVTREEALVRLDGLKAARENALSGKSPAVLQRTAEVKVPDDYVVEAEARRASRELVYDAEYEAFWHPRNVAKVDEITKNPDELWPALRQVADEDPDVMAAVQRVADQIGPRRIGVPELRAALEARKAAIRAFVAEGERPVEWPRRSGGSVIISEDLVTPGAWRVTSVMEDGQPFGHIEAKSFADAVEEAAGRGDVETPFPSGLPEPASSPGFHAGDLGHGKDTTLDRMTAGRSSGHFGTGVYFVSKPERITGRSARSVERVDLGSFKLFRPQDRDAAVALHDSLRKVNDAVHLAPDSPGYVEALRAAAEDVSRVPGMSVAGIEGMIEDAVVAARSDLGKRGYIDSASTRLMKRLGYEGVDVRHIDALDNTGFGTVVYREALNRPSHAASVEQVFADKAYAAAVRKEVVPEGFEPPLEGLIREHTQTDMVLTSGDVDAVAALAQQMAAARQGPRPPIALSKRAAEALARTPQRRRSYQYQRILTDRNVDLTIVPSAKVLADPRNKLGLDVLSFLNHGVLGTKPATLRGTIALLRDIENGVAGRADIGPDLAAEAQRVARAILDDAVRLAEKDPEQAGVFTRGFFAEDELALASTIDDLLKYDEADPLGSLQYGLKKAPKDAVVMEWSQVPGFAEELMTGRFMPFEERVWTSKVKEAFGWVFGPRANQTIVAQTRQRFLERAAAQGVEPTIATAIWDEWALEARRSRTPSIRRSRADRIEVHAGDSPLYAGVQNIPNDRLLAYALGSSDLGIEGAINAVAKRGDVFLTNEALDAARTVDWAKVLRETTSTVRRTLADNGGGLGRALADAYGMAAHNKAATTLYYWFRFGLDIRYHAMNYLEAQILYAGRAGLKKGEIDEGLLGMSEGYLRNLDVDPTSNTGYPFSRDRMAWAYRTFLKEQPDALRKGIRDAAGEDPRFMDQALRELAQHDPQLRDMLENLDGVVNPEKYLGELDAWHRKMLNSVDPETQALTIDDAIREEMANTPHLAELYDRLGQINKALWDDIRATFYGNPNRSRAERFLNSYLLFWPLSYQIKSTKWFAKVLFDRAGGLPTNALGAVTLDRMAETHNRLLATDPEYQDWFERHDTLVFAAQMFFPVSLESTGVSLNPLMRGLFFERDPIRAGEIGPIYTYNRVIRPIATELSVDLYPELKDFLGEREPPRGLDGS